MPVAARLIDISHFQPLITLALIKQHNIKAVAAKCTEGTNFVDPHYATNHSRTRSYGLPFSAYHFARPERSTAVAAADYFLAHANLKPGDRVLMDGEASELGQAATNTWLIGFANRCVTRSPLNLRDCYLAGGYCTNGTGKGLASHYVRQWFPRYRVTGWATTFSPGYPAGGQANTGWHDGPHVWQCSDGPGFDHDVSWMPIETLYGTEEVDVAITQADIDKIAQASAKAVINYPVPTPEKYGYTAATHPLHDLVVGADTHPKENAKAIAAVGKAVAAVAAKLGAVVDPKEIAAAVIASLDPDAIGQAVATALAAEVANLDAAAVATAVADELGKRIEA